ncbi:unnamed protein product [Penicillium bialowiezense]
MCPSFQATALFVSPQTTCKCLAFAPPLSPPLCLVRPLPGAKTSLFSPPTPSRRVVLLANRCCSSCVGPDAMSAPRRNTVIPFNMAGPSPMAAPRHATGVIPFTMAPSAASTNEAGVMAPPSQGPPHGTSPLTPSPVTARPPSSRGQVTDHTSFDDNPMATSVRRTSAAQRDLPRVVVTNRTASYQERAAASALLGMSAQTHLAAPSSQRVAVDLDTHMEMAEDAVDSPGRRMDTEIRAPTSQSALFNGHGNAHDQMDQERNPRFGMPSGPFNLGQAAPQAFGGPLSAHQKVEMWNLEAPAWALEMDVDVPEEADVALAGLPDAPTKWCGMVFPSNGEGRILGKLPSPPPPSTVSSPLSSPPCSLTSEAFDAALGEFAEVENMDETPEPMVTEPSQKWEPTPDEPRPNLPTHIDGLDAKREAPLEDGEMDDRWEKRQILLQIPHDSMVLEDDTTDQSVMKKIPQSCGPTTDELPSKAPVRLARPPKRPVCRQITRGMPRRKVGLRPSAPREPPQPPLLSGMPRDEPVGPSFGAPTAHLPGVEETLRGSNPHLRAYVSEDSEEEVKMPSVPCEPHPTTFEEEVVSSTKPEVTPAVPKQAPSEEETADSEVVVEPFVNKKSVPSEGLPSLWDDFLLCDRFLSDAAEVMESPAPSVPLKTDDAALPVPEPTEEVSDVAPSEPVRKESEMAESEQTEEDRSVPGSYPATLEESVLPWLRDSSPVESVSAVPEPTLTGEVQGKEKSAGEKVPLIVFPPNDGAPDPWDIDPMEEARRERRRLGRPSRLNRLLERCPTNLAEGADFLAFNRVGSEGASHLPSSFSEEHSCAEEVKQKEALHVSVSQEIAKEQRSSLGGSMEARPTRSGDVSGPSPPPSPSSRAFTQWDVMEMRACVSELEESGEPTHSAQADSEEPRSPLQGSMETRPTGFGHRQGLFSPSSPVVNVSPGSRVRCMGTDSFLEELIDPTPSDQDAAKEPRSSPEGSMEARPTRSGDVSGLPSPSGPVVNAAPEFEVPGWGLRFLWRTGVFRVMMMMWLAGAIFTHAFVLCGGHLGTLACIFSGPDYVLRELRANYGLQIPLMDWLVYMVVRWLAGDRMTPG